MTDEYPFQCGCYSITWGVGAAAMDSLAKRDSSWSKVSSITNSKTNGTIVVARHKGREYYLDFTESDKFYSMNYMAGRTDLDSVSVMIQRYYGEPDRSDRPNGHFEGKLWSIVGDSVNLQIELLITNENFSLKVLNKNISN